MDQKINAYLDNLIDQYLKSPSFANLDETQKNEKREQLKLQLYQASVDELLNNLNEDQINQIADLEPTSPQMETKLEEFAATVPNFMTMLEARFQKELANS